MKAVAVPAGAVILRAMRSATRYILLQVLGPLVFVTLTLTGVVWLSQSLRFIDRIVNQGLGVGTFLYLVGLLLPTALAVILPVALFCSVLYAYHRLSTDSELIVLFAAGFSRSALARPALIVATLATAILYLLTLYLMPLASRTFRDTQFEFRTSLAAMVLQEGVFNTPMAGLTVYVRERTADGELRGILLHDNRDPRQPVTMMAERGALVRTHEGPRFIMASGNRQQIDEGRRLGLLYFDSYALDLSRFGGEKAATWREPGERFLPDLLWPDPTNADDRQNWWRIISEGHRRLATPLFAVALTLIALATLLAGEYSRRGQTRRITVAALAAIALQVLGLVATYGASKAPMLIPLLYLNPLAFSAAALLIMRDRWRPPATTAPTAAEAAPA